MKSRNKIFLAVMGVGLPVMFAFQNCAKTQQFAMTDEIALAKSAPVVTDELPSNQEVVIDENNNVTIPSDSGSSSGGSSGGSSSGGDSSSGGSNPVDGPSNVGVQIEDPQEELQNEIIEAESYCEGIAAGLKLEPESLESNNAMPVAKFEDGAYSISGIRAKKFLSAADFNGSRQVKSISNSGSHLVLCDLEVEEVSSTHGHLILYKTKIQKLSEHKGQVTLIDGSAVIDSPAKVFKTSGN